MTQQGSSGRCLFVPLSAVCRRAYLITPIAYGIRKISLLQELLGVGEYLLISAGLSIKISRMYLKICRIGEIIMQLCDDHTRINKRDTILYSVAGIGQDDVIRIQ